MHPELRKAHQQNDIAVITAYGFNIKMTESECGRTYADVSEISLFLKMYILYTRVYINNKVCKTPFYFLYLL